MTSGLINKVTQNIILKELKKISDKDIKKDIRVLDLGCGDGELTMILKGLGFKVYAADIASDPFKNDIPYKKSDFNKGIDYPKNFFDIVIGMEVIEHIENPWFFIDEIYKITKPGGRVFITTPNTENIISRILYLFSKRFVSFGPDLSYWQNSKKILLDKHKTPIFHFLFKEIIYHKFTIEKYLSNGIMPLINRNVHWTNTNIGISKIYILKKN